jgi:hypothetical protein
VELGASILGVFLFLIGISLSILQWLFTNDSLLLISITECIILMKFGFVTFFNAFLVRKTRVKK